MKTTYFIKLKNSVSEFVYKFCDQLFLNDCYDCFYFCYLFCFVLVYIFILLIVSIFIHISWSFSSNPTNVEFHLKPKRQGMASVVTVDQWRCKLHIIYFNKCLFTVLYVSLYWIISFRWLIMMIGLWTKNLCKRKWTRKVYNCNGKMFRKILLKIFWNHLLRILWSGHCYFFTILIESNRASRMWP